MASSLAQFRPRIPDSGLRRHLLPSAQLLAKQQLVVEIEIVREILVQGSGGLEVAVGDL